MNLYILIGHMLSTFFNYKQYSKLLSRRTNKKEHHSWHSF